MYYSENEARELVIKAGLRLIESGLIARTWGNISARISEDEFIITPSGMAYEGLTPEKLVKVKCQDLSYEGNIKPSSEKGIHAISYILRPDVNFIIHTHQFYASIVGLEGKDTQYAASSEYGLPGTDKLKEKVMASISNNPSKRAFFMKNHGALCLGESFEDAFELADKLENECRAIFESAIKDHDFFTATIKRSRSLKPYIDDFAQIFGASLKLKGSIDEICTGEDAEAERMILLKNCAAFLYAKEKKLKALGFADSMLQRTVYLTKYSKLKGK